VKPTSPTNEEIAALLWFTDAARSAPNVAKHRTPEAFAEESAYVRSVWLGYASALAVGGLVKSTQQETCATIAGMIRETTTWGLSREQHIAVERFRNFIANNVDEMAKMVVEG